MASTTLGGTDLTTSRVVLGTMTFGSQVAAAEASTMVQTCLEAGVTHFDTANAYNAGRSEEILGEALGTHRDEVLVATKVFNPMGDGPDDAGLSEAAINKAIDASLQRLQTDYVDLYYLHQPDYRVPIEESMGAMEALREAGKIRYWATSNYAAWQIADMCHRAAEHDWQQPLTAQQMYNPIARRLDDEYANFAADFGVSTVAYNPLAGGLLTGKHQLGATPEPNSRFTLEMYRDRYWNEYQFAAVSKLKDLADGAGITLPELSFRWLLSRPLIDAVLIGASSVDQLRANLDACAGPALDDDLVGECDAVWETVRGAAPAYNR